MKSPVYALAFILIVLFANLIGTAGIFYMIYMIATHR